MRFAPSAYLVIALLVSVFPTHPANSCSSGDCCCATLGGHGGYACRDSSFCKDIAGGVCYPDSNCESSSSGPGSCKVTMAPIAEPAAVAEIESGCK